MMAPILIMLRVLMCPLSLYSSFKYICRSRHEFYFSSSNHDFNFAFICQSSTQYNIIGKITAYKFLFLCLSGEFRFGNCLHEA
jgi:hypothetical protein